MYKDNISRDQYKYYLPQRIGLGSLPNELISICRICAENGYKNEAVIRRSGKLVNYTDGSEHIHKQVVDDPQVWTALWSLT